jgi:tRNA(Ile)-lysidine synthase
MGPSPAVAQARWAVRTALKAQGAQPRDASQAPPQEGPPCRVMVACSGGPDSVVLAAATAFEAYRAGVAAGLVTIDHALQRGSAERAEIVAQLGYEMGLDPVEVIRVDVGTHGGPEAAARTARYAALDALAAALDAEVLLGHTLDDQAETVLLGLGRGSGPRSIVGMSGVDGRYLRPFLGLRRSTLREACAVLGLPAWNDPHNSDPAFQRVRLRNEVLPLLDDVLQGGVSEALARTADLMRDDLDALDDLALDVFSRVVHPAAPDAVADAGQLPADELLALPRAVRTRVLRLWSAANSAGPLSAERTHALDALLVDWHGQGPVDLPGGVAVSRESGRLVAYRPPPVTQE